MTETQMALNAAAGTAGTASNNEGSWETKSAPPLLSEKEKLFMAAIVSSTPADRAQAAWGALKRALGADSDTAQHQLERLKQLADQKGRAETRVRYRFAEDEKTGEVKVVGYHTREGSGMDTVKVRHVKQTAPGTYEFREDGADSPILVWYTTASSMYKALSPQDLPQYFSQRGTPINVNTVPLDDPSMTGQTPGLEIPAQPTWRDGVMVNPQQDPDEMAGNKTETPISDGTDRGPTKTTTPVQESDFRDYILVFPIKGVPAVYVYLSSKIIKNSAGNNVERKYVNNQDELLEAAENAAGGSLDGYTEEKEFWYMSPDRQRKIEWNPVGHKNTNEGPHVTVRDFDGTRYSVTDKIFIKGRDKYDGKP
ncbi:S-type pyocin domain-containing protein [Xenorhabdus griffiniae]|uniref:S-type pyocin domain-containing protein n=1 Tax=Xenorhabdus griffiniae TaxID=351672 RepID=A0ABY9XI15_9GAMM|nr:S-type pyocin domain-containing protein [Xenorhabdus griffiniae]MBD1229429.1 S-type pyocin domain-containing protein [Xenorhabdus griffiniae]WMV72582.1 S-type pyocin domain-containing protein [Xenorhabdus griffiniae]WNH02260.1 S-type pyocin domain-containing protein [Xenorhabdus griffiniae]